MVVKLRIQADTLEDCQDAIEYLVSVTAGAAKMGKPRQGTNPKYEGQQRYASYGELDLSKRKSRKGVPL